MKPSSQSTGHSKTYRGSDSNQALIKAIVFGTFISLAIIPLPSFAEGPSYDCAEAKSEVEITICENPDLASAELIYTNAFSETKLLFDDAMKRDLARILLDRRNTCRTDTNCLSAVLNYGTGFWQGTAEVRITDGLISNQKSLDDTRVAFNRLSEIARKDIQTQLKSDKFYDGEIDGEYGIATWKALKDFGNVTGREQSPVDALNVIANSDATNDGNECDGCEQTSVSVTAEANELPQNTTVESHENSEVQETEFVSGIPEKIEDAITKWDLDARYSAATNPAGSAIRLKNVSLDMGLRKIIDQLVLDGFVCRPIPFGIGCKGTSTIEIFRDSMKFYCGNFNTCSYSSAEIGQEIVNNEIVPSLDATANMWGTFDYCGRGKAGDELCVKDEYGKPLYLFFGRLGSGEVSF